ncbi:MAG: alpha-1,4-glucan--maltose-1-phosphate maltosyltransferase, partial [Acidimicrobiia bacterium]
DWSLRFHPASNDQLICYTKQAEDNLVLVVVNLDPHRVQSGFVELPLGELGVDPERPYQVEDLLQEAHHVWRGPRNYVELDPAGIPAHVFRLGVE